MSALRYACHAARQHRITYGARMVSTTTTTTAPSSSTSSEAPMTHYKITLRRSAISLGDRMKNTLVSLGIHRRHQTVYHRHTPEAAGKILRVKELVEVENVSEDMVRTKVEQTRERRATRGYKVVGSKVGDVC